MARFPTAEVYAALRGAAVQTGVPLTLLMGVAFAESGFDPTLTGPVSASGERAQGLMQLMAATRERYKVTDGFSAQQSAMGGAKYLATIAKALGWDPPAMLSAYVWGPTRFVQARAAGKSAPAEVLRYVKRVLNAQHYYRTQAQRPHGTLVRALDVAIGNLAALNPAYDPAVQLLGMWSRYYGLLQNESDANAALSPTVKRLWRAYADAYERAPLTDQSTPLPADIEPDFWASAARSVDAATNAITKAAGQAAVGVGAGLFFVAVFLVAVSRHGGGRGR